MDTGDAKWVNVWGNGLYFPEDIHYSEELMWVKEIEDNKVRIGISDIGTKSVKRLLYIRIQPRVGAEVKKGDTLGFVETSKRVWEIICPLSGKVKVINPKIRSGNTAPIKTDSYGNGWLMEMEKLPETESEIATLRKGGEPETEQWIKEQVEAIVPLKAVVEED